MYLSNNEDFNKNGDNYNLQTGPASESPFTFNSSPSSSTSSMLSRTLLVVEDNSNSIEPCTAANQASSKSSTSVSEKTDNQGKTSTISFLSENSQDTSEKQRRRNSSIAKLLGGQPLESQQYEEIHQQIIDDQTNQSSNTNGENSKDNSIQRSQRSITRTLLMNAEKYINNPDALITTNTTTPLHLCKDFEYLIRRELDIEHSPSTLHRNDSTPSVFQNLNMSRNSSSTNLPSGQSKWKRKRLNQHQDLSPLIEPKRATSTKTSHSLLMTMCDPFELDSTSSALVQPTSSAILAHRQQNRVSHFDPWYRRHSQIYPESYRNTIASNSSILHYPNVDYFFKFHQDPVSINPMSSPLTLPPGLSSSSSSSSSFNLYPCRTPLELPLPVPDTNLFHQPLSHPSIAHIDSLCSGRKSKSVGLSNSRLNHSVQKIQTQMGDQSDVSISRLSASKQSVPLKKRLLHAYESERFPSSFL